MRAFEIERVHTAYIPLYNNNDNAVVTAAAMAVAVAVAEATVANRTAMQFCFETTGCNYITNVDTMLTRTYSVHTHTDTAAE